jgi:hypothetical protein
MKRVGPEYCLNAALSTSRESIEKGMVDDLFWSQKFFTDNLVIGHLAWPYDRHPVELSLARTIHVTAYHQLSMTLHRFAVRGAITFGPLYMSSDIVFGESLVRAHELEIESARWPRIVLSDECLQLVASDSTFADMVLVDTDGFGFVSYLNCSWFDTYADALGPDVLSRHKSFVERGLSDFHGITTTYQKYVWLAQYHNYFCATTQDLQGIVHLSNRSELFVDAVPEREFRRIL